MDSIDVYLEKKRKRMESLNHSVKRAKVSGELSVEYNIYPIQEILTTVVLSLTVLLPNNYN